MVDIKYGLDLIGCGDGKPLHLKEQERLDKLFNEIAEAPHEPALILLMKSGDDYVLAKYREDDGRAIPTDKIVQVKEVKDSYLCMETEIYPAYEVCEEKDLKDLTSSEIHTKLLKHRYPDLDFDAYTAVVEPCTGDIYTNIDIKLFKIE